MSWWQPASGGARPGCGPDISTIKAGLHLLQRESNWKSVPVPRQAECCFMHFRRAAASAGCHKRCKYSTDPRLGITETWLSIAQGIQPQPVHDVWPVLTGTPDSAPHHLAGRPHIEWSVARQSGCSQQSIRLARELVSTADFCCRCKSNPSVFPSTAGSYCYGSRNKKLSCHALKVCLAWDGPVCDAHVCMKTRGS